jgi:Asp-tRNA(Asn)/Glu-tRNA(Gln) amidotransferase A subunit family amidase
MGCIFVPVQAEGDTLQPEEGFYLEEEALLSALFEADIATIRQALDAGLVTCQQLTAYYLQRIEAYNKPYNCFITICDDAMEVAKQRDQALADGTAEGILFGIPIVIKDNMNLAGYPTTNGYDPDKIKNATSNAQVVENLIAQGAVIIAKANMHVGAQSARQSFSYAAGYTKNAYSLYLSPAGSSGGSAVAVSLNFTAAALGSDTNSSLRLPAAYAGCVSLRATHGLLSLTGCKTLNRSRDVPGAITRTVYDQALMLDALTGGANSYTANLDANALKGRRIGILTELSYACGKDRSQDKIDPEVEAAFAQAVQELKNCGAEVIEVSMPNIFNLSNATFRSNSSSRKNTFHNAFVAFLEENQIEAVIFPSYLSTPLRQGRDENGKNWSVHTQELINNCSVLSPSAGLPEITVPIGLHSLGCGIGLEIAAPRGQEQLLLDLAYSYTLKYDHRIIPLGAPDQYQGENVGSLQDILELYDRYLNPPATEPPTTEPPTEPTTEAPTTAPESTAPETPQQSEPTLNYTYIWVGGATVLILGLSVALSAIHFKKKVTK